jgi:hypothetical protein
MPTEGKTLQGSVLSYRCSICPPLVTYRAPNRRYSHTLDSLGRWPRPACSFRSAQAATLLEFYVPRIVLSVGGSVWYMVRNLRAPPQLTRFWQIPRQRFLILCTHHVSSRLPPSGETCKYATAASTHTHTHTKKTNLERLSTY